MAAFTIARNKSLINKPKGYIINYIYGNNAENDQLPTEMKILDTASNVLFTHINAKIRNEDESVFYYAYMIREEISSGDMVKFTEYDENGVREMAVSEKYTSGVLTVSDILLYDADGATVLGEFVMTCSTNVVDGETFYTGAALAKKDGTVLNTYTFDANCIGLSLQYGYDRTTAEVELSFSDATINDGTFITTVYDDGLVTYKACYNSETFDIYWERIGYEYADGILQSYYETVFYDDNGVAIESPETKLVVVTPAL